MLRSSLRKEEAAMNKATHSRFMNTAASAQGSCADFFRAAISSILVIILDAGLLLGSIFALLISHADRMTAHRFPSTQTL